MSALVTVESTTPIGEILNVMERDGAVIVANLLSSDLVQRLRAQSPDFAALAVQQRSLAQRLAGAAGHRVDTLAASVKSLAAQLAQLNPSAVFERGYSMVEKADGKIVRGSSELQIDEEVKLTFARGWARARVKDKGRD